MCQSLAAATPFPYLLTTQFSSDRVSIPYQNTCKLFRPCRTQNSRCGATAPYGARQWSHGCETASKGSGCRCSSPAAEASVPTSEDVLAVKRELLAAIEGTDRGIGGVQAEKRKAILGHISQLESLQPAEDPTADLQRVEGAWKLLFSTISITGGRRTKLGLRQFIKLGDFTQSIDLDRSLATNQVDFSVTGVGMFKGCLRIEASYRVASPQRVTIDFEKATLEPKQLQALFEQNFDLLLSIFNPEGFLDITFLDALHRIGRDDKGNVFLLERM